MMVGLVVTLLGGVVALAAPPPPRAVGPDAMLQLEEIAGYVASKLEYDETYFGDILRLDKQGRIHPRLTRTEFESEVTRARANHPVLARFSTERKAGATRYTLPQNAEIHREYTNLMGILNMINAWRAGDAAGVLKEGSRLTVRKKEDFGHVRGDASRFYLAMYRLYFFLMAAAHYSTGDDARSVEWVARLEGEETVKSLKQRLATPLQDPQAARELRLEMLRSRPLGVMPFDVVGGDVSLAWAPATLQQVMMGDLARGSDLTVVERGALDKVMDEAALGAAGFTDDKRARDLGKLMGAGTLLLGSLHRQPQGVLLSVRLVDGDDARVLASSAVTVAEGELFAGARRALAEVMKGVGWEASLSVEGLNAAPPPRVETVKQLHQARLAMAANRAQSRDLFLKAMQSDPEVANLFGDLARAFPDATARIAVVDVQNLTGVAAEDWMARGVVEALAADLPRIGFSVVERGQLDAVLAQRAAPGALDAAGAQQVGQLLSADFVVMGSVLHTRPNVRIDVRFVDVRTGVVAHAASAENARDDFMGALKGLMAALGQHFNRGLDETALQQLTGGRQDAQQFESFIRAELAKDALRVQKKDPDKPAEPGKAAAKATPKPPVPWKDRLRPVFWVTAGLSLAAAAGGAVLGGGLVVLGALVASSADAQAYQYQGMQLLAASDSAADLRAQRDAAALRANVFKAVAWGGGALCAAALVVMLGGAGILVAERLL